MSRAKRLEARLQKEDADRERRENAREQRRREREAKEALQKESGGERSFYYPPSCYWLVSNYYASRLARTCRLISLEMDRRNTLYQTEV